MTDKIPVSLTHECAKCGEGINVNIIEVNNIVTVEPCLSCVDKMVGEYKEEIKEKTFWALDAIKIATEKAKEGIDND